MVIDSQSLFDWLVFRNPVCSGWESVLSGRKWKWIFTSRMKSEFDFVAGRGFGPNYVIPTEAVADAYWSLYTQPRDAWTFELEIRPFAEKW